MARKMVMAVVSRDQADRVLDKLIAAGYGATFSESRGGMLRQAQKMMFIATNAESVDDVIEIIRRTCRTRVEVSEQQGREGTRRAETTTTEVGYAVIFVWDLERFETY
ncbi:MAG: cyclic-di-AMP receptor [Anaerolineae bacterium]